MVPSFHLTSRAQAGLIWLAMLPVAFAQAQPGVQVPVAEVRGQAVSAGFEMDGVIQPVRQSTVAAQASGRVLNLAVKVGDRVRSGQLLLTIDDRELVASVQRSRAQVSQSEAELRNAQQHLERTRELQAQGFVSKAALDTAQNQFNGAQAGKEQASAGARQAAMAQGHTRVV
ncbi:MAG: efflux RND transporter periplasmic adaptor subunit, partial [Betaproteobacteria bacterium]|nr:efflux RND transporter periplasmic adaptor subunit [Betaproteobacteria bacterium]